MKRRLMFDGKVYGVTFDECGVVDTVIADGKPLSTRNRVVKKILSNADRILAGAIPAGFSKVE